MSTQQQKQQHQQRHLNFSWKLSKVRPESFLWLSPVTNWLTDWLTVENTEREKETEYKFENGQSIIFKSWKWKTSKTGSTLATHTHSKWQNGSGGGRHAHQHRCGHQKWTAMALCCKFVASQDGILASPHQSANGNGTHATSAKWAEQRRWRLRQQKQFIYRSVARFVIVWQSCELYRNVILAFSFSLSLSLFLFLSLSKVVLLLLLPIANAVERQI